MTGKHQCMKHISEIRATIEELSSTLGEDFIIDFIKTYEDSGNDYMSFVKGFCIEKRPYEIAKMVGIDRYDVNNWLNGEIPWSIRCLLKLYKKGIHNISKHDLARIIGWGFGDGGLDNRPHYYFICGKKKDLLKMKGFIEKSTKLRCSIVENDSDSLITKSDGSIERICGTDTWMLNVVDTSFAVFLNLMGLPSGHKAAQEFSVPKWILQGDRETKKCFLNSLFECELERFRVEKRQNKVIIYPPIFSMNKSDNMSQNLLGFFGQIKSMLSDLGVNSIECDAPKDSRIRKDGTRSVSIRFKISGSSENVINFHKVIDFDFNEDKKEQLKKAKTEAECKLIRMKNQHDKFNKACQMAESGYTTSRIAKELDVSYSTATEWTKNKRHLPIAVKREAILC